MKRLAISASATALCLGALPAFAELSPEQVWDEISGLYDTIYEDFSHDAPRRDGDTLIVENLRMAGSDDEVSVSVGVAEMRLQALDADTVAITTSEQIDFNVAPAADDIEVDVVVDLRQSGLLVTATGQPDSINWTYQADSIEANMSFTEPSEDVSIDVTFGLAGLTGDIATEEQGALYNVAGSYSADSFTFSFDGGDEFETMTGEGGYEGLTLRLDAALPLDMMGLDDEPDMSALFEAGFSVDVSGALNAFNMTASGNSFDTGAFNASAQTGAGEGAFSLTPSGLSFAEDFQDFVIQFEGDMAPAPIEISLASAGLGLDLPAAVNEPDQDLGVRLSLIDLVLSDGVWGLFDPEGQLPRDPASLDIALQGKAMPLVDIFDDDNAMSDDFPFKMESMNLDRLLVAALGARLTGEGAFTFGDEPSPLYDGMQPPIGKAMFQLTGLNAAMEAVVNAGLMPADQLFGVRMMLGSVAVADGEDSYKSEVEVREDGSLFVNGNQLR